MLCGDLLRVSLSGERVDAVMHSQGEKKGEDMGRKEGNTTRGLLLANASRRDGIMIIAFSRHVHENTCCIVGATRDSPCWSGPGSQAPGPVNFH